MIWFNYFYYDKLKNKNNCGGTSIESVAFVELFLHSEMVKRSLIIDWIYMNLYEFT
ncbi:hypothetical protein PIROE2DRAFT_17402 [Piromyces sp. E2]|nr:hypothetical protein PIROE2DRAFT_17402 [Piromyces sp. E2]|eukprot:OUM57571.1 hypothetical protein PIROE2DRAFT_17402 [Piromyces sp. E2]